MSMYPNADAIRELNEQDQKLAAAIIERVAEWVYNENGDDMDAAGIIAMVRMTNPETIRGAREAVDFLAMNQDKRPTVEFDDAEVLVRFFGHYIAWGVAEDSDIYVATESCESFTLVKYLDTLDLSDQEHDDLSDAIREAMSDLVAYAAACATAGLNLL